jgi:hypothetical protein
MCSYLRTDTVVSSTKEILKIAVTVTANSAGVPFSSTRSDSQTQKLC